MKAVKNQQVFEYQGAGENAWFEERISQYYNVLRDFCSVVGTTSNLPGQHWFRNVFDEEAGDAGECGVKQPFINFGCDPTEFAVEGSVQGSSASIFSVASALMVALLTLLAQ
jgi:hypothetical protein